MKLWLVRHPLPLVAAGTCYGSMDVAADAPATQRQASALAGLLPRDLPVISSPLRRCTQLRDALQTLRPDLRTHADARLAEMNFGAWEGQRWDDITQKEYNAWLADFADHRAGGGENVREFMRRVSNAMVDTLASSNARGEAVWITHAGVIRAVTLLASGVSEVTRAGQWPRQAPACGEWCEIWL